MEGIFEKFALSGKVTSLGCQYGQTLRSRDFSDFNHFLIVNYSLELVMAGLGLLSEPIL